MHACGKAEHTGVIGYQLGGLSADEAICVSGTWSADIFLPLALFLRDRIHVCLLKPVPSGRTNTDRVWDDHRPWRPMDGRRVRSS